MGGEDNGLAALAHLKKRLFQRRRVQRVQPTKGFIHNQERRVVQNGRKELHFLLIPFGEFLNLFVAIGGDLETLQPFIQRTPRILYSHPAEARQEKQLFLHLHPG